VEHARDKQRILPGRILVAPPDHHLVLESGRVRLTRGPRENGLRPAIDPLFRSAARVYGGRVVAVVLAGALHDGVAGLLAVRGVGGVAVVQDPEDSPIAALPTSALQIAGADYVAPSAELGRVIVGIVGRSTAGEDKKPMVDPDDRMPQLMIADAEAQIRGERRGKVSVYTCPECGGTLWQLDGQLPRFRCHVGHVYHGESLLAEQADALEAALWTAVRTFQDQMILARQLAAQEMVAGRAEAAARFEERAGVAERYASLIQRYLLEEGIPDAVATPGREGQETGRSEHGTR
jgi:two-component system chemotaxis response regulator CheB